ncbi:MAG: sodium:proton antiporter [Zetaproteobacteria bacterium CG12_big_fil_rev_8_21_14_0_65_55_1124]|nr:MAG: sodium:proton antiporter [Zetaproteobacteria bacterium CG1_02_55_237]PIS18836.1 MAG: sodium:proton antiporter [Zetaproteobacteria bacterium CG08_land_8_20_14_0_20_55_17]PIW42755.1 MAG: sodium:proton antiporter [Zetaproteobacteria bacterium CG12_big_fil_rev_8_21_14_0_65_55_1124]PIY51781.1 MAG: sodium:proton antiporter [Zetaproteobacteria bacterium CG_4_10_14_0_8_um_filter_55_43]PIZ40033.1 MAG: sodium:proton antiporter [Zetaproteobacteria bacterium CG_4_10_14_0_2_um_filter_55_20]PJB82740
MNPAADPIMFSIFLIFFGATVLATFALFARQSLLVAYVLLGVISGPAGLSLISDASLISQLSHIGIVFLLFLLGMNLPPQKLLRMLGSTLNLTLISSILLIGLGALIGLFAGLHLLGALLTGAALLFSSTIIGLKLLPTTVLHHQRTGGTIISILLLQDVIAVVVLLLVQGGSASSVAISLLALPLLAGLIYLLNRFVLLSLLRRFDVIQEYVFLVAIGWCLGVAELAHVAGLSHEIGAFMAGVALASSPIALHIAERLKPLRDFFLIIFFFSVGAGFDPALLPAYWLQACLLAAAALLLKPLLFVWLLRRAGESEKLAGEVGVRLGQMSEFSLLIAVLAQQQGLIGAQASGLIQAATLLSFVASSFWIVQRYPTPIATNAALRRD